MAHGSWGSANECDDRADAELHWLASRYPGRQGELSPISLDPGTPTVDARITSSGSKRSDRCAWTERAEASSSSSSAAQAPTSYLGCRTEVNGGESKAANVTSS